MEEKATGLELLRKPFPENQISMLPKPTIPNEEWKRLPKSKCNECGGWHPREKTIHLSYVGHAALTDRLLDADPHWSWEPLGVDEKGRPIVDNNGGMWIKLTVCGVTRIGYGSADGKTGGNAVKEMIGDALRNAAMRFGAALDLWHKGDLHADEDDEPKPPAKTNGRGYSDRTGPDGHPEEMPPPADYSSLHNPKRTWQTAVAELKDGPGAEILAKKLHEHYASAPGTHDAAMRQLIARVALLAAEGKMPEAHKDSLTTVVRAWIIEPTDMEETERQGATRF